MESKMNEIDFKIATNLRKRRIEVGITQKDLARTVKVTIQQIQKYEKAQNRISGGNLYYFAKALKVPISYFYDLNKESEPELWLNEEKILTVRGKSINIRVNGMQLNSLKRD